MRRTRPIGQHLRSRSYGDHQSEQYFPPPMPLLVQTGNLPGPMPWYLKRSYTGSGRLVLKEVKAKNHQFFRACRVDGRLILRVVHSSECNPINPDHNPIEEEEKEKKVEKEEEKEEEEEEADGRVVDVSFLSPPSSPLMAPLLLKDDQHEWPSTHGNLRRMKKNKEYLSRAASSPSLLSLARPEINGVGGGGSTGECFNSIRRSESLFQISRPTTIYPCT